MSILDGLILGLVQGVSEFLPISSSGHLILVRELLGLNVTSGLAVDAVLHFVTAIAVVAYFYRDIARLARSALQWAAGRGIARTDRILLTGIAIATVPAAAIGIVLESHIETVFRSAALVAGALIAGSLIMAAGEWFAARLARSELTLRSAAAVGFFQTLALIPGMSRSGMAIAGGLAAGLTRADAARFAFLIGIPLFIGAGGKKAIDLFGSGAGPEIGVLVVSAAAAFVSALAAIHLLLAFVRRHSLALFIGYRLVLAVVVFAVL